MTNVLLSCRCRRKFSPPPLPDDVLMCLRHGPVTVIDGVLIARCDDCKWSFTGKWLAPMTICTQTTKHAMSRRHNSFHTTEVDSSDRLCMHHHRDAIEFVSMAPPF